MAVSMNNHGDGGLVAVRWEKFLPKMVLRVLLVEPDDSTRQIITLLLKKCKYKVATVSDGLKAWELLNGKPDSIDLILTEVELPSISGFALLSLITEHEICKNIPVIMMSPHDSVTTVYKCMLRGAADFLLKPVRKNELNNLWQHVWRRQASTSDSKMPDEDSEPQQKVEAIAENNAASNGSGMDAEGSHMVTDIKGEQVDANPSKEAIDLIGSFDSFSESSYIRSSSMNHGSNKVDHPSSMLGLSLGSHQTSSVNQISDENQRVKQSDASAFSPYINRTQPPLPCISNQQKDCEINSDNPLSRNSQQNVIGQHGQTESQSQFSSPKQRVIPVPVAVRSLRFDNPSAAYGSQLAPVFCIQPCLPPMQSPNSSGHQEPSLFQANHYYTPLPETRSGSQELPNLSLYRSATEQKEIRNNEILEDRGHFSSATDLVSDMNHTHWSTQREAALYKFRMKRKDRCYDKKVRYESRKKLAEQRPRVKGQFARQVQTSNTSTMEAYIECGNQ